MGIQERGNILKDDGHRDDEQPGCGHGHRDDEQPDCGHGHRDDEQPDCEHGLRDDGPQDDAHRAESAMRMLQDPNP